MTSKLQPTVAQAKAAWLSHPKPSLNNVLAVLHEAGFTGMAKSTLQRWQARGWPEKKYASAKAVRVAKDVSKLVHDPVAAAQVAKDAIQDVADADLAAATTDEADAIKLAEIALAALAELATRESLTAQILLSRRIQRHADRLVKSSPKEAAKLIEALKGASSNITLVMPNGVETPAEPRMIGGNVIEHDGSERAPTPLQTSIREFRAQQGMKVVK
ncbi:hypothetical protein ABIB86_000449 [Bradyrhizobium sp. JR1.7]|uniref:hypothetical protein n=1 Tax=unclassified Bradyrhizobium TaxID=2631580 RepID=UPI0033915D19